jgi:hypothetical protein
MKLGDEAIKEMANIDANRGMTGKVRPRDDYGREIGAPINTVRQGSSAVAGSNAAMALDDAALAQNFQQQAQRMEAEARSLLAESARLLKEAQQLSGAKSEPAVKSTRGRKKQAVADAAH